eukprot:6684157-Pyramimonas_sp.AAC.1
MCIRDRLSAALPPYVPAGCRRRGRITAGPWPDDRPPYNAARRVPAQKALSSPSVHGNAHG